MQIEMIQHPVGQGSLFSGTLDCGGKLLRWVYDCGSNQASPLQREVARVATDGEVDILFLSHLDSDHISGVDRLLASTGVTEVVLPYLGDIDHCLTICQDIEGGRLTGGFLDFTADPAGWFISRGVQTVTFVHGIDDDLPPSDGPDLSPLGRGEGEGPIYYAWSRSPIESRRVRGATVQHMSTAAVIDCIAGNERVVWVLAPYAHKPSSARAKKFRNALRATFGGSRITIKQIVAQARTHTGRSKLRQCYDAIWCNHNLVSMSLYAGPESGHRIGKEAYYYHGSRGSSGPWHYRSPEIGWLCTGDAYLGSRGRRSALMKHYERFLSRVGVLVVPHHGAATSFHADLILSLPQLGTGIAAAGKNGYGHPHKAIREAFDRHRICFHTVSAAISSHFTMHANA